ncbi:MAG: hypothetical protein AB8B53_07370 [Flavobacteriales bacterium]
MDKEWVKIYSNTFGPKVEMLKQLLENESIPAMILNLQDSAHVHLGEHELFVKRSNVIRAKHHIESWENE